MLLTSDIVQWINERVCEVIPRAKAYGIGKTATRDQSIMPYVDDKYIGIDDVYPAMVYHKELSISSSVVPGSGYGDDEGSLQNVSQMAMIVFVDEKDCMAVSLLYTTIQSAITGVLSSPGMKSTRVNVASAVLNDQQVWRQEYGLTPYALSGSKRLIQVNYNIVTVFDKSCIKIPKCLNN